MRCTTRVVALVGMLAMVVSACGEGDLAASEMVDDGSWYVHEQWPHDGNPIESDHFIVYSDAASTDARRELADSAERLWTELRNEFSVSPSMLHFPTATEKFDIYAYHDHQPVGWSARSYYGGLLIWSPDHPLRRFAPRGYEPTLKHELVHVLQWSVTDGSGTFDTWFIEGLALALARDLGDEPIRTRDRLDNLLAEYGTVNPISIKTYAQITDPQAGEHLYYPLFQLAFEYLLDPNGGGRSAPDARDVMIDVAAGIPFDSAFAAHMGLSPSDLEEQFFDLMRGYLP